ncbi:VanZ family protein (plasmid) [Pontibacillus sp. ALD_SL1]|uniref:VanZ family protein n=1 Tax=Pontibacillus sp. ALD_SL1 TaxID=2777185 RepID=UPI001A96457E|nr:VanZ family protein [Pontibacillus sp. ALD_SL1]QST02372.1 VanZ family protein [Pontibacillus sp. ALD_SL1]
MYKPLFFLMILAIWFLSNTPNLMVLEPKTWISEPMYEEGIRSLVFLIQQESSFYHGYDNIWELNFIVHKVSHVFCYAILTIFLCKSFKGLSAHFAFFIISGLAFSDEVHQYFVVGRSGRLADVGIDLIGFTIGIFLVKAMKKGKQRRPF